MRRALVLLLTAFVIASGATHAARAEDDNAELSAKLERMERDLNFLQKQVYRKGGGEAGEGAALPANAGALEVRISQIDQQIRALRGSIEQTQFSNRQTATELKKLSDDVDFRLRALEQAKAAAPAPVAAAPAAAAPAPAPAATEDAAPTAPARFDPAQKAEAKPAPTGADFPDANAHYAHAFKLWSDKKYSEAATSFDAFVKKYPNDPLTSNSYYWLGESYYARGDYTRSAESFRKGFEVNPEGQKAPDNLFKLAKSLAQVKRSSEACIVLDQIVKKYADSSARTAKRAEDERVLLQCK